MLHIVNSSMLSIYQRCRLSFRPSSYIAFVHCLRTSRLYSEFGGDGKAGVPHLNAGKTLRCLSFCVAGFRAFHDETRARTNVLTYPKFRSDRAGFFSGMDKSRCSRVFALAGGGDKTVLKSPSGDEAFRIIIKLWQFIKK